VTFGEHARRAFARTYVQIGMTFELSELANLLGIGHDEATTLIVTAERAGWIREGGKAWLFTDEGVGTCMA
jgi:hypothetical protein